MDSGSDRSRALRNFERMDSDSRKAGQQLDGLAAGKVTRRQDLGAALVRLEAPGFQLAPVAGCKSGPATQGRFVHPRPSRSEGQIVVGILKRPGEILEIRASGVRRARFGSRRGRCPAPSPTLTIEITRRSTPPAKHDQFTDVDLGAIASLVVLVLPLAILDAAVDVDLVALFAILLDYIGQPRAFGVPHHAPVPLGLFLLLAILRVPLPARRERECRDTVATGRRPDLRVAAQVSDKHHFVQTSAHCASWREFGSRPE